MVSALLFGDSVPGRALNHAWRQATLLLSEELAIELRDVLYRPQFDSYVTREERDEFLEALLTQSQFIEVTELVQVCRDPKDDKILELAVNGNADYVVSGDQDLLTLNPFQGIAIILPAEFLRVARF